MGWYKMLGRQDMREDVFVYVLSHQTSILRAVPHPLPFRSVAVHLPSLDLPEVWKTNLLGEGRCFLSDHEALAVDAEYAGYLNGRLEQKYPNLRWAELGNSLKRLSPARVIGPRVAAADWPEFSERMHPGMFRLLEELSAFSGLPLARKRSLWANDFICHRNVWLEWLEFFRKCVNYFHNKYGWNYPFSDWNTDIARKPAYLHERFLTLWLANRPDLEILGL